MRSCQAPLFESLEGGSTPPPPQAERRGANYYTSPEKNNDPENVVNSKYYDTEQIQKFKKFPDKYKSLTLFHINACSLNKNFDDFDPLFQCKNKVFDIIAVSETRITMQTSLTTSTNINLKNYSIEFIPTESSASHLSPE